MSKLNWKSLLNTDRSRKSGSTVGKEYYNEFDKDYSRIVYSSSVRRLQGKAQVFPLQENDFTRNRLTHSMEVASLGESMAWNVGNQLMKRGALKDIWEIKELASIVKTSSLVHDLGNPPYGHYGEDIIGQWFKDWLAKNEEYANQLSEVQKNDLCYFEGNAQTLRILSKLQILNDRYAANFTYGTLATIIKYPWDSTKQPKDSEGNPKGKFGYFSSERDLYKEICKKTGIGPNRHPATLLMESADDIAYLPTDIEDAVKKRVISWQEIIENTDIIKLISDYDERNDKRNLEILQDRNKEALSNEVPELDLARTQNLKISLQSIFIEETNKTFLANYESIMNGAFEGSLLEKSDAKDLIALCENIAVKYIFGNKEVLTLELVGDRVISDLLDLFVPAIIGIDNFNNIKSKSKSEKLYKLISNNYRYVFEEHISNCPEDEILYSKLQLVTDFISGMTDNYALTLHQQLMGVEMP